MLRVVGIWGAVGGETHPIYYYVYILCVCVYRIFGA